MVDKIIDRRIELWKQISATTVISRAKRAKEMMRAWWTMDEICTKKSWSKIIQPKKST